jgi:Spy/CpxP family protein refolding chaperone
MKKIAGIIIIALLAFGIQAFSQPSDDGDNNRIIKKLNLTKEQKIDANKIKVDMEKQLIAQKAKMETARLELREILNADSPDKSDIEKKLSEIADLEVQTQMIRVDSWFSINTILTPEQQKVWGKALVAGPAMKHDVMDRNEHKPMTKSRAKKQMEKNEEMNKPNQ